MTETSLRPQAYPPVLPDGAVFGRAAPSGLSLPPRGFVPAGEVSDAWLRDDPFRDRPARRPSASQAAGLRYEKKAAAEVKRLIGDGANVHVSPWIGFKTGSLTRVCQPDVVIEGNRALCIIEVKYAFTSSAYWQLVYLYRPVCSALWRGRAVGLAVLTRSFDPDVAVPCPVEVFHEGVEKLEKPLPSFNPKCPTLNVILWKP